MFSLYVKINFRRNFVKLLFLELEDYYASAKSFTMAAWSTEENSSSEPVFKPLSAEDDSERPTEIESLCMECGENVGKTGLGLGGLIRSKLSNEDEMLMAKAQRLSIKYI